MNVHPDWYKPTVLQRAQAQQRLLETPEYRDRVRTIAAVMGIDFQFEFKESGRVEAVWIREEVSDDLRLQYVNKGPIGSADNIVDLIVQLERDCGITV